MTAYTFFRKNILYLPAFIWLAACLPACKKHSPYSYVKPETIIYPSDARLQANSIHLSADTVYVFAANVIRESGQDLTIEAGTLIKMSDYLNIIIRPGATINARGTATQPIIFTSSAAIGTAGVPAGGTTVLGVHAWRGIHIYGSTDPSVGSGVLNYVRIEFAGSMGYAGSDPYPYYGSLYLNNVSKNTSIEHVQISYSLLNPSFDFAGGDVDARYLVSYASPSADFNLHQGYKGRLQHLLGYREAFFPTNDISYQGALYGLYIQDDSTFPSISNLTILGPDPAQTSSQYTSNTRPGAFQATLGARFHIRNSILMGFPGAGWYLGNTGTATSVANNLSTFRYSIVHCNDSAFAFYLVPGSYSTYNSHSFRNFMLSPAFGNELYVKAADFQFRDPFNYDASPNPLPDTSSQVLKGANFDGPPFDDPFFNKVSYRGALGPAENWLQNWTNFTPLKTNYNVK